MPRKKKEVIVDDDVFPPDDVPEVQVDAIEPDAVLDDPDDEGLAFPEGTTFDEETGEIVEPSTAVTIDFPVDQHNPITYTYEVAAVESTPKNSQRKLVDIPLEQLVLDERFQPRSMMNQALVDEYTEDLAEGDEFPPVDVIEVGGQFYLTDGWHRAAAHRALARTTIQAYVTPGGLEAAILASSGANASHGLRRTNADKRRAVIRLLTTPTLATLSDSALARAAKVSVRYVGIIRTTLEEEGEIPEVTDRIGVDGKVRDTDAFKDAINAPKLEQPKDPIKDVPSEFDNPDDPDAYTRTEEDDDGEYLSLEESAALAAFDQLARLLLHSDVVHELVVRMGRQHRREQYTLMKERFGELQNLVDGFAENMLRDIAGR